MLTSFIKSVLPQQFLYPPQRRYRDRLAALSADPSSVRRLAMFLVGGIVLASMVLLTADALRTTDASSSAQQHDEIAAHDAAATDGRGTPDTHESLTAEQSSTVIVTQLSKDCAAHARERLMTGLTHYYLQRRLRPGASSDDAADASSLTGVLVGPGDPAATTTDTSCTG
jgi:hypothetical protein